MTAIRATYADWRLIKTRSVVQVVFEVPLHDADAAYEVLGGMPKPSTEQWFAIAAISAAGAPQQVKEPAGACAICGERHWKLRSNNNWYCTKCRAYTEDLE